MNRLRMGGQARISFFSFQDIITSVTGILILVTLMLSFSMQTGDPKTSEEQTLQAQLQTAREQLAQIELENQTLQKRRIEAAALPDRTQLQTQIELLQREQSELQQRLRQSTATLTSARERLAQQAAQRDSPEEIRRELASLETQLNELRQKAAHARTNVNVIYIVPDAEARRNPRAPLAIVVSADRFRAQRLNGADATDTLISGADSLQPILAGHNPERDFIVFYFRPSGVKWFEAFRALARERGFEVGYDAVEEQKEIVFANP